MNLQDKLTLAVTFLSVVAIVSRPLSERVHKGRLLIAILSHLVALTLIVSIQWGQEFLHLGWISPSPGEIGKIDFAVTTDPLAMIQICLFWFLSLTAFILNQSYSPKIRESYFLDPIPMALLGAVCVSLSQFALAYFLGLGFLFLAAFKAVREDTLAADQATFSQIVQGRFLIGLAVSVLAWAFISSRGIVLGQAQTLQFSGRELGFMTFGASLLAAGLLIMTGMFSLGLERDGAQRGPMRLRWFYTEILPAAGVGFIFFRWSHLFNTLGIFNILGSVLLVRSFYAWLMVLTAKGSLRELNFIRGLFTMSLGAGMLSGPDGIWVGVVAATVSNSIFLLIDSTLFKIDSKKHPPGGFLWSPVLCLPLVGFIGFFPFYLWMRVLETSQNLLIQTSICFLVFVAVFSSWRLFSDLGSLHSFQSRKISWILWSFLTVVSTVLFWTGGPLTGLLEQGGLWFFNLEDFVTQTKRGVHPTAWTWAGYLQLAVFVGAGMSIWLLKYWVRWGERESKIASQFETLFGISPFFSRIGQTVSKIIHHFDLWQTDRVFGVGIHRVRVNFQNITGRLRTQSDRITEVIIGRFVQIIHRLSLSLVNGFQRKDDHWYLVWAFFGLSFLVFLFHWFGGSR